MNWWPALETALFAGIGFLLARLFDRWRAKDAEIGRLQARVDLLEPIVKEARAVSLADRKIRFSGVVTTLTASKR